MSEDKKLTTTGKALIGAGTLALAAGALGAGKLFSKGVVAKKQLDIFTNEAKRAVDEFKPQIKKHLDNADKVKGSWIFGGLRSKIHQAKALVTKNQMEGKFYEAAELAKSKKKDIEKNLSPFIKKLDRNSMLAGGAAVGGGLLSREKKAELSINATKESEEKPKPHIKPNLILEPTHYSRGFQSGPIMENADKMSKIAEAVNSLFPKEAKDEVIEQQAQEIDSRDEALAQHEMAHKQKDQHIEQIHSAIEEVNQKLLFYREQAVSNYQKLLDAQAGFEEDEGEGEEEDAVQE